MNRYHLRLVIEDVGARYHGKKTVKAHVTAATEHDARRRVIQTALDQQVWVRQINVDSVGRA